MEDEDRPVRMTVREIALMRRIIAYRKEHEIEFVRRRVMGTYWVDAFGHTGPKRRSVALDLKSSPRAPFATCAGVHHPYRWLPAESLTQAVDLLVAYGYLPAKFSSSYWNGTADTVSAVRVALGDPNPLSPCVDDYADGREDLRAEISKVLGDRTAEVLG